MAWADSLASLLSVNYVYCISILLNALCINPCKMTHVILDPEGETVLTALYHARRKGHSAPFTSTWSWTSSRFRTRRCRWNKSEGVESWWLLGYLEVILLHSPDIHWIQTCCFCVSTESPLVFLFSTNLLNRWHFHSLRNTPCSRRSTGRRCESWKLSLQLSLHLLV